MSGFVCDGTCNGTEFGDCSHPEADLRASLAAVTAERDTLQRNARVEEEAYIKLQVERDALAKQVEIAVKALEQLQRIPYWDTASKNWVRIPNAASDALAAIAAVPTKGDA